MQDTPDRAQHLVERPAAVRVIGVLDPPSRGLWLVKWLLLLPHLIVLALLWVGFAVLTVYAFFAIVVTGRYPRGVFDFTAGVLRWSWRVHYYGYGALGTDRYPPFTLADVPDYPARLEIDYPPRLSRGLVLVKWWLLALPHYLVVGLLVGGGTWGALGDDDGGFGWAEGGLVGVLVLVAGVVLLFTGSYPRSLHGLVVGLDRWVLRVVAYATLMTDEYPPFRLDTGATEPGTDQAAATQDAAVPLTRAPHRWTAGRIVAVIAGAVLVLTSMGLLTGGAGALWADRTQRDADGFLTSPTATVDGAGHALTSSTISLSDDVDWVGVADAVGKTRITASGGQAVFLGVGPTADVERYLSGVAHTRVTSFGSGSAATAEIPGGEPATGPGAEAFWIAATEGPGAQRLTWTPEAGQWTVVVMNADASAGVAVQATASATLPALPWLSLGLLVAGVVVLTGGTTMTVLAVRRAKPPTTTAPTPPVTVG
ncbi:DUF4389 domain-containing protein [Actinokineospora terrae]|uniref:DUF4389 domain-containing protein n=1 Tax=Actinokineospora terrae TaxID=155974 RepID=A0A1H9XG43_9PSEU|nr:DUF4389 domain-containing protein [Actinokineospora terrae]SES45160.1 protein of unknown function [Actinokineospora terrae]